MHNVRPTIKLKHLLGYLDVTLPPVPEENKSTMSWIIYQLIGDIDSVR